MGLRKQAEKLLNRFKGSTYAFGLDKLDKVVDYAAEFGDTALVIANTRHLGSTVDAVVSSLERRSIVLAGGRVAPGARLNSPREDVYRIKDEIWRYEHSTPIRHCGWRAGCDGPLY